MRLVPSDGVRLPKRTRLSMAVDESRRAVAAGLDPGAGGLSSLGGPGVPFVNLGLQIGPEPRNRDVVPGKPGAGPSSDRPASMLTPVAANVAYPSVYRQSRIASHLVQDLERRCPSRPIRDAYPFVMGLHKLTAGDGYTYLTRQVAAMDATERGSGSLEAYYSQKGEAPGRWVGSGLAGLDMTTGEPVSEAQMVSLFRHGRHPNGADSLGRAFKVFDPSPGFHAAVGEAYRAHNADQGLPATAPVAPDVRAGIRTEVALRLFAEQYGHRPTFATERLG